jgi:hypothetical protein
MTHTTSLSFVRSLVLFAAVAVVPFAVASACKKKDKPAAAPLAPSAWGTPSATTSTPAGTGGAPATGGAPGTGAAPAGTGGTAAPAVTPGPLDLATQTALDAAIELRAKNKDAKFMKQQGPVFGAVVAQGGSTESAVTMIDLGKCYSVVAQGGPGVTELDIQIVATTPIAGIAPVVAVDNTAGPEAAITPCWKNSFPVGFPAKVVLTARGGTGAVAGKIYVK